MELNEFVAKIAEQYEDAEGFVFVPGTHFKELDEYDSLTALTIIAMVDEDYKITISNKEIRECTTIEDLFNVIKSKKNG